MRKLRELTAAQLQQKSSQPTTITPSSSSSSNIPTQTSQTVTSIPPSTSGKPRIAIVGFQIPGYISKKQENWLISNIESEIVQRNRFTIVERAQLEKVLREQSLGLSGFIDPNTAVPVGKLLGAQGLVTGTIREAKVEQWTDKDGKRHISSKVSLSATIIDARTGAVIASPTVEGYNSKNDLNGAFQEAAHKLAKKITVAFPIETVILKGGSDTVILAGGSNMGLTPNWEMEVVRYQEYVNPTTKEKYVTPEKIGLIRVDQVYAKTSKAIVLEGKGFVTGDYVRSTKRISGLDPNLKFGVEVGTNKFSEDDKIRFLGAFNLDYNLSKHRKSFLKPTISLEAGYVPAEERFEDQQISGLIKAKIIPISLSLGLKFGGRQPRLYVGAGINYIIADYSFKPDGPNSEEIPITKENNLGFHLSGRLFFSKNMYTKIMFRFNKGELVNYSGIGITFGYNITGLFKGL